MPPMRSRSHEEDPMKKKHHVAVPDFSRKRPVKPGATTELATEVAHAPDPRQPLVKPTTTVKKGGRRGG
jgi:hypothetical protein